MAISYNKLWKLLIDNGMTKTSLRVKADFGTATLAKLSKNQQVNMDILLRICEVLKCGLSYITEVIHVSAGGENEKLQ